MAKLIPYLFPTITPAYGNVKLTPQAKSLAEEGPWKLLELAIHFKTLEELERNLP